MRKLFAAVALSVLIAQLANAGPFAITGSSGGGGSGTVTSVSVTTANGVSGTVANPTTTPAISLSLGAITPSTVSTGSITATTATLSTLTGLLKANGASPITAATSGTDYAPATSGTSILKGSGTGGFASAVSATDYAPATTGTSILKASAGGFANAVSGTDYAPATSGSSILKGNGAGGFSSATSGTDYAPATTGTSILYGNNAGGFSNVTIGSNLTFSAGTLSATGGGSPGGSGSEIQYRSGASTFGAVTGSSVSGGNVTLAGTITPTQTIPTSGTVTVSTPLLNGTQTWNAGAVAFTADLINVTDTASASSSLLIDRQVGGSSKFKVDKSGVLSTAGDINPGGKISMYSNISMSGWYGLVQGSNGSISLSNGSGNRVTWSSITSDPTGVSADTGISRAGAAATLAIGNGTAGDASGTLKVANEVISGVNATSAAAPTIASAATIAPTTSIAFISGTTQITTITAPSPISSGGGQITLIPTGLWTTGTTGNIALATTAVVSKALILTYDTTTAKWYPSY